MTALSFTALSTVFMIQGGCPDGTGMGGRLFIRASSIRTVSRMTFATQRRSLHGKAMHPNSAGSQFFIMHKAAPIWTALTQASAKITEGMDVVNRIAEEDTDYQDRPLDAEDQIHDRGDL